MTSEGGWGPLPVGPQVEKAQLIIPLRSHHIIITGLCCLPAKLLQSCPTLCNPMDCSPPGSSVHGILHARVLEWVALPSSKGSSWPRVWTWVSCIASRLFTIWATRETLMSWSYPPSPQSAFSWGCIRSISDTLKHMGFFYHIYRRQHAPSTASRGGEVLWTQSYVRLF